MSNVLRCKEVVAASVLPCLTFLHGTCKSYCRFVINFARISIYHVESILESLFCPYHITEKTSNSVGPFATGGEEIERYSGLVNQNCGRSPFAFKLCNRTEQVVDGANAGMTLRQMIEIFW